MPSQAVSRSSGMLLAIAAAVAVGVVAARLSPDVALLVLTLVTFMVVSAITPLSAIVIMLILSPLRALIATEAPLRLPLDIGQLSVIGLAAVWIAYRIAHDRRLLVFEWSPIFVPVLIFTAVVGLSAFSATSLGAWLTEWLKWVLVVVLVALVLNLGSGKRWEWLVFGLVMAGAANALVGLYIFFGGSGALHLLINNRFFRAFGTFGQPNPFGGFMGLLAPIAMMAALGYGLRGWRQQRSGQGLRVRAVLPVVFYATASLLLTAGIFASWSRGAWLSFVIAIAVMAFALPRRTLQSVILVAVVGMVIGGLWFTNSLPASVTARISSATDEFFAFEDMRGVDITPENYAIAERLAHWQAALNMATAHPWLGVGAGNYEVVYDQYRLLNWVEPLGHAHNYYLNILAEAGIIGLTGYVTLWMMIVWFTWRTRRHPDTLSRCIAIGLLGTWSYLSVHSLLDNLYVNNLFLHLGVMIGILAILYNQTWKSAKLT